MPGRRTQLRFGGFVQANFIHDFQNTGFKFGEFIASKIPVPTENVSNTEFDPRPTRLTFETQTPTERVGVVNTLISIDFFGQAQEDSIQPRLRQAYLSWEGLLTHAAITVGQAWTTFSDLSVWPDIFDLEGPSAMTVIRQVVARASFSLDHAQHLVADFAVEQPETEVQNGDGLTNSPDLTARINWHQDWGTSRPQPSGASSWPRVRTAGVRTQPSAGVCQCPARCWCRARNARMRHPTVSALAKTMSNSRLPVDPALDAMCSISIRLRRPKTGFTTTPPWSSPP